MRAKLHFLKTFGIVPGNDVTKSFSVALLLSVTFLLLGASVASAAAELNVELALSKSEIMLGEQASLTVTVSGPSGFSEPVLPDVDDLDIIFQGRTQSVQIINMKVKSSRIFRYTVVPHKTGEFPIGPVQLKRKGRTYESKAVRLSVVKPGQVQTEGAPQRNVIVEASVDNANPYVGQQVTLFFRIARRSNMLIKNAGYRMPDFSDFWSEGMESRREYAQKIEDEEYLVTEIAVPLFPITEGDLTIGGITLHYNEIVPSGRSRFPSPSLRDPFGKSLFDDDFFKFFRSKEMVKRTAYTKPIRIRVRPLPSEGRPEEFKGGVGSFSITARLSADEMKVGESVTLTLALSGEGNIRDISDPSLHIDGVKIYSDMPAVNVKNYNDTVVGEKVYKLALVPQRAGQINIPQVSIPYFNPQTVRYEVASSTPPGLKVLPSEKDTLVIARPGGTQSEGKRIALAEGDILPIHERIGPTEKSRAELWLGRLRPVAYPLPIVAYALCFAIIRHRERLRTDTAYRRHRFAAKTAVNHIENACEAIDQKRWDEVFTECSRAVTEYLADKLDVPAGGLTTPDIESALSSLSVSGRMLAEIIKFLKGCEYGRFAASEKSLEVAREYVERARRIIESLEKEEAIKR